MLGRESAGFSHLAVPDLATGYRKYLAAMQSVTSMALEDMLPTSL